MADYDSTAQRGTLYTVPVRFIFPTTANTNEYTVVSGNTYKPFIYIRGFTGSTEVTAIGNHNQSGGMWVPLSGSTQRTATLRVGSTINDGSKVFARVEAYWPGREQKGIKYSKGTTLCGHGSNEYSGSTPANTITVYLDGVQRYRYVPYGQPIKDLRKINPNMSFGNYTDDLEFKEIIVSAVPINEFYTTSCPTDGEICRRERTVCTWNYVNCSSNVCNGYGMTTDYAITAMTSNDKYKTAAEIAFHAQTTCESEVVPCDDYCYLQGCDGETDCTLVCDCDEESTCYSKACAYDCASHTCSINFTDICKCYSSDDDADCQSDLVWDDDFYTTMTCFTSGYAWIPINVPTTALTLNITGMNGGGSTGSTMFFVTTGTSSNWPSSTYMRQHIRMNIAKSGDVYNYDLYISGTSYVRYSVNTAITDIDFSIGNNYIHDNIENTEVTGSVISNSTFNSSTKLRVGIDCAYFRYSHFKIFNNGELYMDVVPSMQVRVWNGKRVTDYGARDLVSGAFFYSGNLSVGRCGAAYIPEGDYIEVNCVKGPNTSYVGQTRWAGYKFVNLLSGVPLNTATFRYEGAKQNSGGIFVYTYTGSTSANTTFRLEHSGSSIRPAWLGSNTSFFTTASPGNNVYYDYTFGNKYAYNNNTGAYAYSGETYPIPSTTMVGTLEINIWYEGFRRLRVYDDGTLVADLRAVAVNQGGFLTPGIRNSVNNTITLLTATAVTYCDIAFSGDPEESTAIVLKCMNGTYTHYQAEYEPGETIDTSLIPQPSKTGYDFIGWNPEIPSVMPDTDFTTYAQFSVHTHTVTYYLKDGSAGSTSYTLYATQEHDYGSTFYRPTVTPAQGWEFNGWDFGGYTVMPDQDVSAYGEITEYIPTYTIYFYSGTTSHGSTPSCRQFGSVSYHAGDTISYPSVSRTCMYAYYGGWKTSCTGGSNAPSTMPSNNINVYYVLGYNEYTITWRAKKSDASTYTTYSSQTAEYLDSITSGPDLTSYAPAGYTWDGWNGADHFSMPCSNKTVNGTFNKTGRTHYTLAYYVDGSLYATDTYESGETVTARALPTPPECEEYSAWNGVPSTMPANNVSATTSSSYALYYHRYYINTWSGGTELFYTLNSVGNINDDRTLPNKSGMSYTPWSGSGYNHPLLPCSDSSAYTQESRVQYTATFKKADGTVYSTVVGYYGSTITRPSVYTKPGYTVSWPSTPATFPASNVVITAIETAILYTATFRKADGTYYSADTGYYGEYISYPSVYTKTGYYVSWPSNPERYYDNYTIYGIETAIPGSTGYTVYAAGTIPVTIHSQYIDIQLEELTIYGYSSGDVLMANLGTSVAVSAGDEQSDYLVRRRASVTGCTAVDVSYELDIAPADRVVIEILGVGLVEDSRTVGGGRIGINGIVTITGIEVYVY